MVTKLDEDDLFDITYVIEQNYPIDSNLSAEKLSKPSVGDVNNVLFTDNYLIKVVKKDNFNEKSIKFWNNLHEKNIVNVPKLFQTKKGDLYVKTDDKVAFVSEKLDIDDYSLTENVGARFGEILKNLHTYGKLKTVHVPDSQLERVKRKYAYLKNFDRMASHSLEGSKEELRKDSLNFREKVFKENRSKFVDVDYEKPVFLQHRDFQIDNLLKCDGHFYLIDFDFVGYNYAAMEVVRMIIELYMKAGREPVRAFFEQYSDPAKFVNDYYKDMPNIYLRYLLFNDFPFYLNTLNYEQMEELVRQRHERIQLLLNEWEEIKYFMTGSKKVGLEK